MLDVHHLVLPSDLYSFFFFFNDTASTEIYTLSLHDALPILAGTLYPLIKLTGILFFDVVTFLLAIGALLLVHIPQPPRTLEGQQAQGNMLKEARSEEHTSELQSQSNLVCRLLLEKKKKIKKK